MASENSTQTKTYLDHEVELAYENIRHCQNMMRIGGDCVQDISNLLNSMPTEFLTAEDKTEIKDIFENLQKIKKEIGDNVEKSVGSRGQVGFKSPHNREIIKNNKYRPERDMSYKRVIQIVINRIHIERGKTTGSFNMV